MLPMMTMAPLSLLVVYFTVLSDTVFRHGKFVCHLSTLREESIQNNVILQYKLLTAILSAVCCVIQQS